MHGCGNDYLFATEPAVATGAVVRAACDRRHGLGADGLITIAPDGGAIRMRIFNADGSDGGMCGNGARCAVRLAMDLGWTRGRESTLLVGDQTIAAERLSEAEVRLTLPPPRLELPEIPVSSAELDHLDRSGAEHRVGGLPAVFVNVGNPHLVSFRPGDPASANLAAIGPRLETHRAFPERMNVHLARVDARDAATVRSWERGAGLTLACGTGALATVVAGVLTDRLDRAATVRLPGGELKVEWLDPDGSLRLTGPTAVVYEAEWLPPSRAALQ